VTRPRTIKELANRDYRGYENGRVAAKFPRQPNDPTNPTAYQRARAWQVEPELPKIAAMAERLAGQCPDGWTVTAGRGWRGDDYQPDADREASDELWVRFERVVDGVRCTVWLGVYPAVDRWAKDKAVDGVVVEGDTYVDGGCFTRSGIDSSSCELVPAGYEYKSDHDYYDVASLLAGEQARSLASAGRRKTAEAVPGLPFTRQPEWFAKATADLKAGKAVQLTPHGFGVGYTLRLALPGAPGGRAERAAPALEARLGVSPIAVMTFDYD